MDVYIGGMLKWKGRKSHYSPTFIEISFDGIVFA